MNEPVVAQYKPYYVDVVEGERYLWCSCGLSKTQPWCDQSHAGTAFKPLRYVAEKTASMLFCGCKHSAAAPFCDGSHNNLVDEYEGDPRPLQELLAATSEVPADEGGFAALDGGCYVQQPQRLTFSQYGNVRMASVIGGQRGAKFLDQYYLEVTAGTTPVLAAPGAEVVLFGLAGKASVDICGHRELLAPQVGVYLRAGEAFTLSHPSDQPLTLLATVCPGGPALGILDAMPASFDASLPRRAVARDDSKRNAMADRFYQVLVGEESGSREVSQFIGQIPQSKAAPHHHLYEEAIVILSGEGIMWTDNLRTPVKPGDLIFLPAKQLHSLQSTSPGGMLLAGHFYPAGSPAINY
ncbi:MAG: CDGSH iron-sulfur domain-containing protein [Parahaliea sp.]